MILKSDSMKHYTRRNIRRRVIELVCAFAFWGISTVILWDTKARFICYMVFIMLILSSVDDYRGWRKSKSSITSD
jgi:hypothetical protein